MWNTEEEERIEMLFTFPSCLRVHKVALSTFTFFFFLFFKSFFFFFLDHHKMNNILQAVKTLTALVSNLILILLQAKEK